MDTFDRIMIAGFLGFNIVINCINHIDIVNIEKNIELLVNALVK